QRSWRRPLLIVGVAMTGALAVIGAREHLDRSDWENFQALEITGELARVDGREIRRLLAPYLEQGFVRIDMRGAREALSQHPWIAEAAVRRQWPGVLVVELREEQPAATWFGTSLMNEAGVVFLDGA